MKVLDWNIKCYCDANKIADYLLEKVTDTECIITLQEVMPDRASILRERLRDRFHIVYSLDYRVPDEEFDTDNRRLGIMLLASKDMMILEEGIFTRCLFPERTLYVVIRNEDNRNIKVASFHSITGVSFKMGKAVQFRSFAECIRDFEPDIVTMDANEPKIDHFEISKMDYFDQGDSGKGARLFFDKLNINLRDSYVDNYDINQYKKESPLTISHILPNGVERRYDFVFVNKHYKVNDCLYHYEEAINASSDHAMIEVNLSF